MDYTQNKTKLTLIVDDVKRMELRELKLELQAKFQADQAMHDFLEPLISNSELQWLDPSDTGDLTDAPMLGVLGETTDKNEGPFGAVHVGHWDDKDWYQPILQRWAYMDYQVKSPLDDLLDVGLANFVS